MKLLPLGRDAVGRALEKAERYRLLNDAFCAESICLDVLQVEPENQQALVTYVLALTDQFHTGRQGYERARQAAGKLHGEYERSYYAGIVCERRGHADAEQAGMASREAAWGYIHEAMSHYEKAMTQKAQGNEDAVLRWNTCVRLLQAHGLRAPDDEKHEPPLE